MRILLFHPRTVECGVICVEVTLILAGLLRDRDSLTEALIVHYLPLAQEPYRIDYIGVVDETKDVIVGQSRFLLCCNILVQVGENIARYLERGDGEGCARCRLRIDTRRMVDKIGVKSAALYLVIREIFRKLSNDSCDYLLVRELFRAQRSIGNVPMYQI